MFPQLARWTDLSLLLLRLMVATVFVTSGWTDIDGTTAPRASSGTYSTPAVSMAPKLLPANPFNASTPPRPTNTPPRPNVMSASPTPTTWA